MVKITTPQGNSVEIETEKVEELTSKTFPSDRTFLAVKSTTGIQSVVWGSSQEETSFVVLGIAAEEEKEDGRKYYLLEPNNARLTAYRLLELANKIEGIKYQ